MKRSVFLLVGLGCALPVAAGPNVALKCDASQDKVWVYGDLKTMDVSARVKCGTAVDVLSVANGYLRIRTPDGNEGFVPLDAVPAPDIAALLTAAAPPTVASAASVRAPSLADVAAGQHVNQQVAQSIATPTPAPVSTTIAPKPPVEPKQAAPSRPITPSLTPAPAAVPKYIPGTRNAVVEPSAPVPQPAAKHEDATLVVEAVSVPPVAAMSRPSVPAVKPVEYMTVVKKPVLNSDDDDDAIEANGAVPEDEAAACNVYFSAYGLTPMQFKWMAADRHKRFPGVCPAPEPSMVDYVVIFTHDMATIDNAMPEAIHTDHNGFSDWSPITAADDTIIPISSLDKAHHEYAWVFHVRRGTFDPAKFSNRRKPLFTKIESSGHASSKSIEDAVQFMAQSPVAQSVVQ